MKGPDPGTFLGFLNACASVALEEGRCVHEQIIQCGFESDIFVDGSLVDMYAKCGALSRMHAECSTGWPHMMWSLGMP
jgi:hypothetical protein